MVETKMMGGSMTSDWIVWLRGAPRREVSFGFWAISYQRPYLWQSKRLATPTTVRREGRSAQVFYE